MAKTIFKISFLIIICFSLFSASGVVFAQVGGATIETNSATNISNNQATLNGTLAIPYLSTSNYVWFQWGTDTNYGNTSFQQMLNYPGQFIQQIANLSPNTTYHFRAVAQVNSQTVYGQDMSFNSNGSNNYFGSGSLIVAKQVINLSSGNLNWQNSVYANPGETLSFAITLQAGGQDIHNVVVRDILPAGLIYKGNMTINASLNNSGDPSTGINVGTIPANGIEVIAFQVCVASPSNFVYGNTTLVNTTTITGTEIGTQTASASVVITNSLVHGATNLSTGLTNNPITDSFFLPILLIILGSWLYFSGKAYVFADWLGEKIN